MTPSRVRRRLFDREAPLGYALVIPAVLYLGLFIGYPFFMSIYMSFTGAQAGDPDWTFVGTENYSKVDSHEVTVNDLVVASVDGEDEASAIVAGKDDGKTVSTPADTRFRIALDVAGHNLPLVVGATEDDAAFLADTVLRDFNWRVEREGKRFRVVAHSDDAPITLGRFPTRDDAESALKDILVPAAGNIKTNGTGVLQDPNFLLALKNTFKYTIGTEILKFLIGVPCALLLNRKFGGRRIVRGLIVIPWVIPIALSAQGWLWILDSTYSVINWALVHGGIVSPENIVNFRGDKDWAMLSLIVVNVWRGFPFTTILILAGLSAIPDEILERARLDGANPIQRFFYIIAPMVRPILMVGLLFSVIFSFTDFNTIWIITHGGPYDQTQVLSTYAYQLGVNAGYLGKGAAVSLFMFPIMAVMVFFVLRFLRKEA